jgi:hypothetical protein
MALVPQRALGECQATDARFHRSALAADFQAIKGFR